MPLEEINLLLVKIALKWTSHFFELNFLVNYVAALSNSAATWRYRFITQTVASRGCYTTSVGCGQVICSDFWSKRWNCHSYRVHLSRPIPLLKDLPIQLLEWTTLQKTTLFTEESFTKLSFRVLFSDNVIHGFVICWNFVPLKLI